MQPGISMAGQSPAPRGPSVLPPVPPHPREPHGGTRSGFAQAAVQGEEWRQWASACSEPQNAFGISATTDIHHLPFQERSMPARRLMTGLAEQTPCLHRLLKKKKEKKKSKPWALLKTLYHNPPPEQNSLYITPERRRAGVLGTQPRPGRLERFNRELPWGGRTCAHQRERSKQLNRNRHKSRCNSHRKP